MFVRIARFEGGTAAGLEAEARDIRRDIQAVMLGGEPAGAPAELTTLISRLLVLQDKERGSSATIMFFASEDDLRKADSILQKMSPQSSEMGHRVSFDTYEVAVDEASSSIAEAA
jgi:hypothetical protein